jgi:hypothetical protein
MTVRKLAKHFFLGGIMLVLVSACAAVGGGSGPLTEDERLLRQRSSQFQKNVLQGALAGGVLGGLLGGVIGGDVKSAVIGAGGGAVAGGAGGYYVTKRQQEFASEEARIASMTADVEADNTELKEYLAVAGRVIAADKAKLAKIERQYAANQLSLEEAQQQAEEIQSNREVIAETIDGLREKQQNYVHAMEQTKQEDPTRDVAEMDRQIEELGDQIAQLEGELDGLSDALSVLRVG